MHQGMGLTRDKTSPPPIFFEKILNSSDDYPFVISLSSPLSFEISLFKLALAIASNSPKLFEDFLLYHLFQQLYSLP
ncbi:hypothetical protein DB42_BK00280 [Neochlamydia sp. EPS4]|nr:hypothetical protein DB42_BK00280 [Neochlamydia sp. EPS4]